MHILNEAQVVDGCKKGDRRSQNLLFISYERKVFAICLRYTDSPDEACDVQQESFIKIFKALPAQQFELLSLGKWISRVTVNTAIDFLRNKRRFLEIKKELPTLNFASPRILDELNESELIAFIQTIPNPYRVVFNLYIIEGYSHREIGEMLEIGENTSRSYLTRAKELIRKLMRTETIKLRSYGRT